MGELSEEGVPEYELERFPRDEFEKVNVKEIPMGFHVHLWPADEIDEWIRVRNEVTE